MAKTRRVSSAEVLWLGDEIFRGVSGAEDDALYAGGEVILASAQGRAPRRKGRLVQSGYVASATRSSYQRTSKTVRKQLIATPGVAVVAFAEFYARFVEGGTGRHEVKIKRAKALQTGAARWARRATVKGTPAVRFLHNAAESEAERVVEAAAAVIKRAIGG